ncbi:MAG: VWA domain-containing protein [Ignavibacterium sp.]|nr:VWA domain-containing protein [Ignavibacterium sp.]
MFKDVVFLYPWVLFFLILIPILTFLYFYKLRKKEASIKISDSKIFNEAGKSLKTKLIHLPFILKMFSLILLIIALARPQSFSSGTNVNTEGIDIAIVLDISGSMLAEDFKPNRLEAAKRITDKFIEGRVSDRIGLVIFSRVAFTQCPLTIDYAVLRNLLKDIRSGMLDDGTAIGNAIANGVNRLKNSDAKSKVIILITDGVNNAGEIDPLSASEIAKAYGIKIYSIGVGTIGEAPYPIQTPFGIRYQMVPVEIDEVLMRKISEITGGQYFRATNNRALEEIYNKIDAMEKSKVEITSYRTAAELYSYLMIPASILFLIDLIFSRTIFRKLP